MLQILADRQLLDYATYEDYLNSYVTCEDLSYLENDTIARKIVELGYTTAGATYTCKKFLKRKAAVKQFFYPKYLPTEVISRKIPIKEVFLKELAKREEGNRNGNLATIIFMRHFTKKGFEVSGFIDYADRLSNQDFTPIFEGKTMLKPRNTDLSFFHWRNNETKRNNSLNFKVLTDPVQGLLFQCWHDRQIIHVNPKSPFVGGNTTRRSVLTTEYEQVLLYDHMVRRRC